MTGLNIAGVRLIALLILQVLWLAAAHSQPTDVPISREELQRQERIYQSQGENVSEGYVIDRSLISYSFTLSAEFERALANLGPDDRWLDIGAGRGQAVLDYYGERYDSMHPEGRERRGKKASAVAMSIEDRREPAWYQTAASLEANKIQYIYGKRLREYTLEQLGKFQIITDVLGGFSYTENLSTFMEKTLGFLAVNSSFFTVLQDVHSESGQNSPFYPGARYLTELVDVDGSELKVCSWLKRITCVEVTCEFKRNWRPHIEVYRIHKVCDNVAVPTLTPVHFEAGTPPERRFQISKPAAKVVAPPDQVRGAK